MNENVESFAKKHELCEVSFCTKKNNSNYYYATENEYVNAEAGLPILIKETDGHCNIISGKEVFDILAEVNPYK